MKKSVRFLTVTLCAVLIMQIIAALVCPMYAQASADVSVIISGSTVNVRAGAGTDYDIILSATRGTEYQYVSQTKDGSGTTWYQIIYSGTKKGWVTGQYSKKLVCDYSDAQSYIDTVSQAYGAVGTQVALIENGKVTSVYNYGYSTKSTSVMTTDTKIRVASLSKIVVAMSAMRMQEQGLVDIDANIGSFWLASVPKAVTLRSLLSHTSTLKELSYVYTREETLAQITSASSYNSGTVGSASVWKYCNYAVGAAGTTLELVLEKNLSDYADEQFFSSLGIDASWHAGAISSGKLATLYYSDGSVARSVVNQATIKPREYGCNTNSFAGGLTISAKDMAKLVAVLANDGTYDGTRYLSEASVSAMENRLFTASENGGTFSQCMPLRYKANLYGQSELYYHTGNAYGVLSMASYNPTTRCGVVVITTGASANRDSQGVYAVCSKITKFMYESLSYTPPAATEPTTTVTTTTVPTVPEIPAQSISVSEQNISMKLGEEKQLEVAVEPASATDVISFVSSSKCVAVDGNGRLTAVGYGTAVITVSGYETSATCTVEVVPDIDMTLLGASIRVSDPYGIRFGIQIKKDEVFNNTDIVEYGTLIIGAGTLGSAELELDTESVLRIPAVNILSEDDAQLTYTGVLIDIPESFFNTNVTARGYLIYKDVDGVERVLYTNTATKNFTQVAQAAYNSYSTIESPSDTQKEIIANLEAILKIETPSQTTQETTATTTTTTESEVTTDEQ
ncbi:MAG: serine hydrolase [Clostridia bacterium]|nr:serine hydrolase [Clostridia bacterium]